MAVVLGSLVTGMFLTAQGRRNARTAAAERREQRALARVERVRAAVSDLGDALSTLLSAYSEVVESAREEPGQGGASEFVPTVTSIGSEVRSVARQSWFRFQNDTGLQLAGRRDVDRAVRRLDQVFEDGTIAVFDGHGAYQGDALADLSHAHTLLGELQSSIDMTLAVTQAHAQKIEADLETAPNPWSTRAAKYLGV